MNFLGYVPKNYEKRIQAVNGYRKWKFTNLFNPLLPGVPYMARFVKLLILI